MYWKFLYSVLLITSVMSISAQTYYSKAQILADIDTLVRNIYEVHPDMYYTYPQSDFEKELAKIKQLPDSLTAWQFYIRM